MIDIRPATPADRPALAAIQSEALVEASPDLLTAALDGPLLGLVAVDPDPVGYLLALDDGHRGYLPELAVTPERQGNGIGSALLSTGCERLREAGVGTVRVTARASDDRVREFYKHREFEQIDRVPDHYADGTDGIVYERELSVIGD